MGAKKKTQKNIKKKRVQHKADRSDGDFSRARIDSAVSHYSSKNHTKNKINKESGETEEN